MAARKIKQIIAPAGDWFRIQVDHVDIPVKRKIVTMGRVTAWVVTEGEGEIDLIEGISVDGTGHMDESIDYGYVHGDDLAPNAKTWRQVFNELPSDRWHRKDLSDMPELLEVLGK
jgi:hypothetical protein